jgi:Ca-activated chloride channel homolog
MSLGAPEVLPWLALVPGLALFFLWTARRDRRALARLGDPASLPRLAATVDRRRRRAKRALVLVGATGGLLALAAPRWGTTWEEVQHRGIDLVVVADVSRSMLARDGGAGSDLSRLERARREAQNLLRSTRGDRLALVAFAGQAVLECPLTFDHGALELFLQSLDPDLVSAQGSDLGAGIRLALEAFEGDGSPTSRAILLLSDGEDHGGRALEAAEEARSRGIKIFALGIGTPAGSPLWNARGELRRDERGEVIVSRLAEGDLQRLAELTQGHYRRARTTDLDLEKLYQEELLPALDEEELSQGRRRRLQERFQWFLALALVGLALEPLVSDRRRAHAPTG